MQSVREGIIAKVVEQVLLLTPPDTWLTLPQLEKAVDEAVGGVFSAVRVHEVRRILAQSKGRIESNGSTLQNRSYQLTEKVRGELESARQAAEGLLNKVVASLFQAAKGGSSQYLAPFLQVIRDVFADIAGTYVRLLSGEATVDDLVAGNAVRAALSRVPGEFPNIDHQMLKRGVYEFLRESRYDYDQIKWNMTQNHYVQKALGFDHESHLLSKEVLGDAIFYIDTNVAFQALEPRDRHFRSFKALSLACQRLNIEMRICQISIDELRGVVKYQTKLIEAVDAQIPDETAPRVESLLFQVLREERTRDGNLETYEVFKGFSTPIKKLDELYGVKLVDSEWFDDARNEPATMNLAKQVRDEWQKRRPGRVKRERAAMHDALLLRWVAKEKKHEKRPVWLLTLDTSLPAFMPYAERTDFQPLALTLDALLQWISPIAAREGLEGDLVEIFSKSIRHYLLPYETFFELEDFLIFSNLQMSCRELAAEDVEKCVDYLKSQGVALNLSKPEDREQLASRMARFLTHSSRKYRTELAEHEQRIALMQTELEKRLEEMQIREQAVTALSKKLEERDAAMDRLRVESSAKLRLTIWLALVMFLESTWLWVLSNWGIGENFLQKVVNGQVFLSGTLVIGLVVGWVMLGAERIRTLGQWKHVFSRISRG